MFYKQIVFVLDAINHNALIYLFIYLMTLSERNARNICISSVYHKIYLTENNWPKFTKDAEAIPRFATNGHYFFYAIRCNDQLFNFFCPL